MSREQRTKESLPLWGLRVGISGAVPERSHWGKVVDLDRLILSFVSQLSRFIVDYGGEVVHGSQPLFTPVIAKQAAFRDQPKLTLVASQLWGDLPSVVERAQQTTPVRAVLTRKIGTGGVDDPQTRNPSLTAMRRVLAQRVDVLVAVGGKIHRETGFNAGVVEELVHARACGVPRVVVGSLGGAAGSLERDILDVLREGGPPSHLDFTDHRGDPAAITEHLDEHVETILAYLAGNREELLGENRGEAAISEGPGVELVDVPLDLVTELGAKVAEVNASIRAGNVGQLRQVLDGLASLSETRTLAYDGDA